MFSKSIIDNLNFNLKNLGPPKLFREYLQTFVLENSDSLEQYCLCGDLHRLCVGREKSFDDWIQCSFCNRWIYYSCINNRDVDETQRLDEQFPGEFSCALCENYKNRIRS
jgi:hypothetical protein